jgi:hypothetical protein
MLFGKIHLLTHLLFGTHTHQLFGEIHLLAAHTHTHTHTHLLFGEICLALRVPLELALVCYPLARANSRQVACSQEVLVYEALSY